MDYYKEINCAQDFVAGLAAVRKREPSIEELVYQHEIAGDYGDALACYESMGKGRKSIRRNIVGFSFSLKITRVEIPYTH